MIWSMPQHACDGSMSPQAVHMCHVHLSTPKARKERAMRHLFARPSLCTHAYCLVSRAQFTVIYMWRMQCPTPFVHRRKPQAFSESSMLVRRTVLHLLALTGALLAQRSVHTVGVEGSSLVLFWSSAPLAACQQLAVQKPWTMEW